MTLEELQIVFSQKGGEGVLAQISKISTAIDAFVKKHSKGSADVLKNYQKVLQEIEKKQAVSFGNISKKAAESNRNVLSFYDAEIKKLEELRKAREEAYGSASGGAGEGGGSITGGRGGGIGAKRIFTAAMFPLVLFRLLDRINKTTESERLLSFNRENQEMLSGTKSTAAAVGYDIGLSRYGGIRGEGLESLRSFSAQLGMATRGDVSFLQTLGRWGISGVSPYDDPMSVAKKIAARARELSPNEQNALFESVGFTNAQASAALKGDFSIFEKAGETIKVSEKVRDAQEKAAVAAQEVAVGMTSVNKALTWFSNVINSLRSKFPKTFGTLDAFTPELNSWASGITSAVAIKQLLNWGKRKFASNAISKAAVDGSAKSGVIAIASKALSNIKKIGFTASLAMAPNTAGDANRDRMVGLTGGKLPYIDPNATNPYFFNIEERKKRIRDLEQEARGLKIMIAKGKASQSDLDELYQKKNSLLNPEIITPANQTFNNIGPVNITVDSENAAEKISTQLIELANAQ